MISFANALEKLEDIDKTHFLNELKQKNYNFYCSKVIEPSKLFKNESILEIVIANIYNDIKNILNNNSDFDETRELLDLFHRLYTSFKIIYADKKDLLSPSTEMVLEDLDNLSQSQKLKQVFNELVYKYLKLKNKGTKKAEGTFLIIPIDDLDMNTDNCFETAEEIRKFFDNPNIIVLMAIRIEQFNQLVQQEYLKSIKLLYDAGLFEDKLADLASKYVVKLIPTNRRQALPELRVSDMSELTVEYELKNDKSESSFVDYFLGEIYKKTGLLLLKNKASTHDMLPNSLREIQFLYNFLDQLEEVDLYNCINHEEESQKLNRNLQVFEDYFISNYIKTGMPTRYTQILNELMLQENEYINKFIVGKFIDDLSTDSDRGLTGELSVITAKNNLPQNVSIGDVLYVLRELNIASAEYATKKLVEGIKIIYSLRILKLLFVNKYNSVVRKIIGASLYNPKEFKIMGNERNIIEDLKVNNDIQKELWYNCIVVNYGRNDSKVINYKPKYEVESFYVDYATIDFIAPVCNLIDLSLLQKRAGFSGKRTFSGTDKVKEHLSKYIALLPIWSIDFIDELFVSLGRNYDLMAKSVNVELGEIRFLETFIRAVNRGIKNIITDNRYLDDAMFKDHDIHPRAIDLNKEGDVSNNRLVEAFWSNPVLNIENIRNDALRPHLENILIEGKKVNSIDYSGTTPQSITVLDNEIAVNNWAQVLNEVIRVLCDSDPANYNIIRRSPDLSRLNLNTEPDGKKKEIRCSDKKIYITNNFRANNIVRFCEIALRITGNSPIEITLQRP